MEHRRGDEETIIIFAIQIGGANHTHTRMHIDTHPTVYTLSLSDYLLSIRL